MKLLQPKSDSRQTVTSKTTEPHVCVCRVCSGNGVVYGRVCRQCDGSGRVWVTSEVTTYVKPYINQSQE